MVRIYSLTYLSDVRDFTLKGTVVNENLGADLDSLGQLAVVGRDTGRVSLHGGVNHDLVHLALLELNGLTFLEGTSEDGWSLGVEHDGHILFRLVLESLQ